MDHSPKKSKALLITIIAVIILLILGYFLFFRNNQIFGLKSSSGTGTSQSNAATDIKNFVALLFKPKAQQTTTDTSNSNNTSSGSNTLGNGTTTGNTNTGGNQTDTGGFGNGGTLGSGDLGNGGTGVGGTGGFGAETGDGSGTGFGTGSYGAPTLTPLPTPTGSDNSGQGGSTGPNYNNTAPQCSDGIDNNTNGLIDIKESGCHTDFNAKNITSYDPTINDEARVNPTQQTASQTMCPSDDPLVFTDDEKAQLQSLLAQYYLIAPELKNSDDLTVLSQNIATDQSIIDQAGTLTQQCLAEKSNPNYTGPQYIKDNPYYKGGSNTPSYVGSMTFIPTDMSQNNSTDTGAGYTGMTSDQCVKQFNAFQTSQLVACLKAAKAAQDAANQNNNNTNTTPTDQSYGYFENQFNIW